VIPGIVRFLALVFTALALVPGGAHLFAMPNKIGMSQEQYFIAQRAYDGWWMMSFILIPAMACNAVLAVMLRADQPAFRFALAGSVCFATTLAIFFMFTQPANLATQNWTVAPSNWDLLRTRWEYSHALNAVLTLVSFCLVALAVLTARRDARNVSPP
jgi:ABC-type nickel/cobalt efflux system permease component RcnA